MVGIVVGEMKSFEWINKHYGLKLEKGMRVKAYGEPGTVVGSRGAYVKILLDGDNKPGCYHPTDGIYCMEDGEK